jgi:hypothetical protein
MERFHARTALAVAIDGRNFGGQAGKAGDGIRADACKFAGATDVAHGNVFDRTGVDLRVALEERAHYLCAYFVEACGDKLAAAAAAKGRARPVNDDSVLKFQVCSFV